MHKFIQRNQKKLLAVFGVLLMIVFIIPSAAKNGGYTDPILGKMGDVKIYGSDEARAKDELRVLGRLGLPRFEQLRDPGVIDQFDLHPELYALLQKEAHQQGIAVSDEVVLNSLQNDRLALRGVTQSDLETHIRPAVANFLLVESLYQRSASAIKISRPQFAHALAERVQKMRVNIVEFAAADFVERVPAPTPEQIKQQYNQYASIFPGEAPPIPTTAPSSSFGYRYPARFKLQYLELPAEPMMDAFVASLTPQQAFPLDVAAQRYYDQPANRHEFVSVPTSRPTTTSPATNPATTQANPSPATTTASTEPAPATLPTTAGTLPSTQAATAPTTRPFAEVRADLRRRFLRGEIPSTSAPVKAIQEQYSKFQNELRQQLRDALLAEYPAYEAARHAAAATRPSTAPSPVLTAGPPTTAPTTAPASIPIVGIGSPYESVDYLRKAADDFEAKHHVRPTVTSIANEWQTGADLGGLEGIQAARDAGGAPLAEVVARQAQGTQFPPATQPSEPGVHLFEPSPILSDGSGNVFIYRLAAYDPEHVPTLEEAEPQISKDLRLAAAYERAKQEAKSLVESVQSRNKMTKAASLPDLARVTGRTPIAAGPLAVGDRENPDPLPGYDLAQLKGIGRFMVPFQIAPLQQAATPEDPHPVTLVDLPDSQKVLVVEAASFELPWPASTDAMRRAFVAAQVHFNEEANFIKAWYDYDTVVARASYVSADKGKSKSK